jgi:hypothetical protein
LDSHVSRMKPQITTHRSKLDCSPEVDTVMVFAEVLVQSVIILLHAGCVGRINLSLPELT